MGGIYLTDMAHWLRQAGLIVVEYDNWKNRARGSGGYDAMPLCVMWHHTASPASWDGQKDADYCTVGDSDAPLANLYIERSGIVWVLAAGATNTNGKGKSISFSRGTVPTDGMNSRAVGIEMGNDGVGEQWPISQINAAFLVSNTINAKCGNRPDDVSTHEFYAPDRKVDPATNLAVQTNGNQPWMPNAATSSGTWHRGDVQNECTRRSTGAPLPPTEPPPTEPPPVSGTDWWTPLTQTLPTLREGDHGTPVLRMQHLLCAIGAMNETNIANYDGVFGSGTEGALNGFKISAGGSADGLCDPWTWGALLDSWNGIPTIEKGASGTDVKRMQHLLAAAGYMDATNMSNYDGVWGNGTDGAKSRFDIDHNLGTADTSCGQKSWTSLLNGQRW